MSAVSDDDRTVAQTLVSAAHIGDGDGNALTDAIAQAIADARREGYERENRACEAVADEGVCSETCAHDRCDEARKIRGAISARRTP